MKVSALLRAGHKVSEVAHLVGVSRTIIYAIMKRMNDGEGVNRRAGSGRKTVADSDSLRDAIRLLRMRDNIQGDCFENAIRGTALEAQYKGFMIP